MIGNQASILGLGEIRSEWENVDRFGDGRNHGCQVGSESVGTLARVDGKRDCTAGKPPYELVAE